MKNNSFFFYDLETSGFNPKEARIMQFAGRRTDLALNPVGEPFNFLVKMTDDILPDPDAVLITGITPQKTISEGINEAEFLKIFNEQIAEPDTIFVGFNTIRFDDEFMRYTLYRNFYEPYEWQWRDGRSKWDILDVVRMTRALRPDGINWPFDEKGMPINRLEPLASVNKLVHTNAHDALSDVEATIGVARLIRDKQSKLFDFLLSMRDKKAVAALSLGGQPFVYTSGNFAGEFEKTTVVGTLTEYPEGQGVLVFDLRYDPRPFAELNPRALAEAMRRRKDDPGPRLPVKTMKFNRCPAIAPLSVLDEKSQKRLRLNPKIYMKNYDRLQAIKPELTSKILKSLDLIDVELKAKLANISSGVDAGLYDGFFSDRDKSNMESVRTASADALESLKTNFKDGRLRELLPYYKARNFPGSLSDEERARWEQYRKEKIMSGGETSRAARYFSRLEEIANDNSITKDQKYLLEELQLYGQSILPMAED